MRRILLFCLLALILATGVAACGGGEDQGTGPESVSETGPEDGGTTGETETGGGETETEDEGETETEDEGETETEGEGGGGGNAEDGKAVFASAGCGSCHTLSDAGTSGNIGPNLDERQPSQEEVATIVANGRGAMPSFSEELSEQEIQDVATYVAGATSS
jgi:cytochrome c553